MDKLVKENCEYEYLLDQEFPLNDESKNYKQIGRNLFTKINIIEHNKKAFKTYPEDYHEGSTIILNKLIPTASNTSYSLTQFSKDRKGKSSSNIRTKNDKFETPNKFAIDSFRKTRICNSENNSVKNTDANTHANNNTNFNLTNTNTQTQLLNPVNSTAINNNTKDKENTKNCPENLKLNFNTNKKKKYVSLHKVIKRPSNTNLKLDTYSEFLKTEVSTVKKSNEPSCKTSQNVTFSKQLRDNSETDEIKRIMNNLVLNNQSDNKKVSNAKSVFNKKLCTESNYNKSNFVEGVLSSNSGSIRNLKENINNFNKSNIRSVFSGSEVKGKENRDFYLDKDDKTKLSNRKNRLASVNLNMMHSFPLSNPLIKDNQNYNQIVDSPTNNDKKHDHLTVTTCDAVEHNFRKFYRENKSKFNEKISKGPPSCFRWICWTIITGIPAERNPVVLNNNFYSTIDANVDSQIKKDISRTLPLNLAETLSMKEITEREYYLYRILKAFASNDKEVSYCQGMNYIVSFLLQISAYREVEAYYMTLSLFSNTFNEKLGIRGFYTSGFSLLNFYVYVFHIQFKEKYPRLYKHLIVDLEISDDAWISKWFMTLYTMNFPIEVVARIWDCILVVGLDFIISFAIVFLGELESKILKFNDPFDVVDFFKSLSPFESIYSDKLNDTESNINIEKNSIVNFNKPPDRKLSKGNLSTNFNQVNQSTNTNKNKPPTNNTNNINNNKQLQTSSKLPVIDKINLETLINAALKFKISDVTFSYLKKCYEKENKIDLSSISRKYDLNKSVHNSIYEEDCTDKKNQQIFNFNKSGKQVPKTSIDSQSQFKKEDSNKNTFKFGKEEMEIFNNYYNKSNVVKENSNRNLSDKTPSSNIVQDNNNVNSNLQSPFIEFNKSGKSNMNLITNNISPNFSDISIIHSNSKTTFNNINSNNNIINSSNLKNLSYLNKNKECLNTVKPKITGLVLNNIVKSNNENSIIDDCHVENELNSDCIETKIEMYKFNFNNKMVRKPKTCFYESKKNNTQNDNNEK